ncbi:MAG: hypothetical protein ACLU3U_12760 [Gallintestinimicrobium sp.]
MAELVRVAVDAMGGDNAPTEIIKVLQEAAFVRDERVKAFWQDRRTLWKERTQPGSLSGRAGIEVAHASEVIETGRNSPGQWRSRGKKGFLHW